MALLLLGIYQSIQFNMSVPYVYFSVSIYLFVSLPLFMSLSLSFSPISLSLSVCLSVSLSVGLCLSACLSVYTEAHHLKERQR